MPNLLYGTQTTSGAKGTTPTQTHPPDICTASEGIKLTRVHHGFPRAGALEGGAHLGIPYPQMAERRAAVAAISMVTAGVEARSWTDPGALLASRGPDDGVHGHCAPGHQACQRSQPVKGAGSRSRAGAEQRASRQQGRVPNGLSQAAVHSRAAGSGCSIQPDLQDGRIRPWDELALASAVLLSISPWLRLGRSG